MMTGAEPQREAWRLRVKGRVQGVGFRYFTFRRAEELGVKGWVRNLPNGEVEIHAEADRPTLTRFLAAVQQGPPFSAVEDVELQKFPVQGHETFSIKG
ncbi:MAG: acylphosphatase [Acidobacteriota bacterium]